MTVRRKSWAAVGLALVVLAVALPAAASTEKRVADETFAIIPAVAANPAQQAIVIGFKKQSQKLGYPSVMLGGEFNPQAQITAVNAAIQRRVAVLAIWPLDPKGIRPALDRARKAGIKVVTMWTSAPVGQVADFQYAEGPAARKVAALAGAEVKKGGKSCKVGIIQGLPVVPILKARNDALAAGAKAAGCEILEQQVNEKDSADGALPIVQAWKTKWGSEMTAILAYNDPSALGAVAARSGDFEPVVTGMNADPAAIQAIKKGDMLATTTIPNPEMGNAMAYAGSLIVKGKKVPKALFGRCDVVTKANAARYVPWGVRNRKALTVRFVSKAGSWYFQTAPDYTLK
ncbi:MAG: sugar ABC transporter substrate-binding protein [Gaiellales bacterium]